MKAYTDLKQSKKLAEILPLESADLCYIANSELINIHEPFFKKMDEGDIPCWSLASLLSVLPMIDFTTPQLVGTPKTLYRCMYNDNLKSHACDNPVDACYEMIIKLHELEKL